MTCPGGCLGGGGEPKSDDKDILKKRMEGIYAIDSSSKIRKSHENKEVQQLYHDMLGSPLSDRPRDCCIHPMQRGEVQERNYHAS